MSKSELGAVRILVLEDSEDDFFLVRREMERAAISHVLHRIQTADDLRHELLNGEWELILSDYNMPQLNAIQALKIVQQTRPDIPFVVVSGSIGEEQAVELVRHGAADYLMKDRLTRLPAVIVRELRDAQQRRDQRRLQRELRHMQKIEALGTLAGGIAHDFNNVLMAISGFGELALEKLSDNHSAREDVHSMIQAAERSRGLVKKLMAFARRQEASQPEQLDLNKPIHNALALLRPTLPANIELNYKNEAGKYFVRGDAAELEQIIVNLCTNGSHAIGKKPGTIRISLDHTEVSLNDPQALLAAGIYCRVMVSDNGCGMSPEVRTRVFEPFFTTKPTGEGTGLGLPMVHGVVTGMGGAIAIDSEAGQGTTFTLYFPAIQPEQTEESAQAAARLAAPGNGEHIMVVDDEELLVNVTSVMLQQAGYRVTKFFDPASALTAFKASPDDYNLLLSDLAMPGMTGAELARKLREIRPALPVVLSTGFMGQPESELLSHASIVLQKPYTRDTLYRAVREALQQPAQKK